jgi:membrane fusion protein (multidrug efflux system)
MVATAKQGPAVDVEAPQAVETSGQKPKSRRGTVLGLVFLVAAAIGVLVWLRGRGKESTDDAQVDGEVVAVPTRTSGLVVKVLFVENQSVKEGDVLAELDPTPATARLAQAKAALDVAQARADAADADSRLAETNAKGNKAVSDAALATASVGAVSATDQIKEAEAQVRTSEASAKQAREERDRAQSLFDSGAITRAELDRATTAFDVATSSLEGAKARLATLRESAAQAQSRIVEASARAEQASDVDTVVKQAHARARSAHAEVDSAKAAVDLAALELSYTKITAPHDGVASKKTIAVGQTVVAGQTVTQLVTPALWVTGNFKETQISKMRVGQRAEIEVDAFPGVVVSGAIESFSGATGSRFTLLPPDNASGNFTKVVQRVPVRVKLVDVPRGIELRPGLSVDLTLDTR